MVSCSHWGMFSISVAGLANFREQLGREEIYAGKFFHAFY